MRFVEKPEFRPHQCCVIPGRGQDPEGFIDTGNELVSIDPHIYCSAAAVREMCRTFGWPTPEEYREVAAERDQLAEELAVAREELVEANRELDAVYVLRSKKWTPAKKPGRPRKTAEVE